jgi:hypothetical protein
MFLPMNLPGQKGLYKIYGRSNNGEQIKFSDFLDTVHPDDRTYVEQNIQKALKQKNFLNSLIELYPRTEKLSPYMQKVKF